NHGAADHARARHRGVRHTHRHVPRRPRGRRHAGGPPPSRAGRTRGASSRPGSIGADMSVFMIFRVALKALNRNKMRTALTMLGMIIGVAAVITMVALGTGAQSSIEAQIATAGTNMIIVQAGNYTQGGVRQGQGNASTLTPDDATDVAKLPGVQYTSASLQTRGQMVAGNQNWNTQAQGVDIDFPLIRSWTVTEGAFFTS